jgi:MFS family permease
MTQPPGGDMIGAAAAEPYTPSGSWVSDQTRFELALAVAGKAAAALGTIGFAALAPFVRDEFDLSSVGVGGVMGVIFVGALIATIPAGRLTDRVPAGRMLGICLLVQALGLAVAILAPSASVFFLAIGLVGLAMGAGDPSTNVLVAMNVPRRRRGLLMGVKQTGFTLGGVVGGLVLPSLAAATSWRIAVLAPIAICVAIGGFGLWVAGSVLAAPKLPTEPLRPTSLLGIGSYGFLMAGIQISLLSYLAVYFVDQEDLTATKAGFAIAATLAGGTVGRIAWGLISDRLLSSRFLALQAAALGACAALVVLSVAGAHGLVWPVLFALGFCAIGWNTVYVTVAAESVDASSVGRATGQALFFSYAGGLAFPPLLGVIHDGTGSWTVTWLSAAGIAGTALLVCSVLASAGRR